MILVIGEALVDVVIRDPDDRQIHPGGSPLNVAVGLSRLDVPAALATQLADDAYANLLRQHLHASGARYEPLDPTPDHTSTAEATITRNSDINYSFDVTWNPRALPDPTHFEAVHVGSLGTVLEPGATAVAELVISADVLGIPVSFDPNVRLSVDPDPARWRQAYAAIAPYASIIRMSQDDAAVLFPESSPSRLARQLAEPGPIVAITCGADGAHLASGGHLVSVPGAGLRVIDTIGAGDSFMSAMLAWCATYDWPRAHELDPTELTDLALYASSAAAITCSRPGADPPWTRDLTP